MSDTPTDHDAEFDPFGNFLVESAPYRALAYRFWSTFFLGRDTPEWRARSGDVVRVTAALLADDPEEDPLADVDAPTLARAFATLFYGVGEETVPLTTSAWTGAERLTAGRATDRARAVYRAHGLEVKGEDENLPEDHLGIALAFLADLAQKTGSGRAGEAPSARARIPGGIRPLVVEGCGCADPLACGRPSRAPRLCGLHGVSPGCRERLRRIRRESRRPPVSPEHVTSEELWFLSALWETRSLTLAAKRIDVSVATATRLMTRVREKLHDPLFVRGAGGFVPTPRMVALFPKIRETQSALVDIAKDTVFDPASIRRTIRIAGVDNAFLMFLLPCVERIHREAPGLRLAFLPLPEDYPKALEVGDVDLVIYAPPRPEKTQGIRTARLVRMGHALVVREGHPLLEAVEAARMDGRPLPVKRLQDYKEVELTYGPASGRSVGETSAETDAPDDAIGLVTPYFLAAAFAVMKTDFYVRLPAKTADLLAEYLPIVKLPEGFRRMPIWDGKLIWHERTDLDPALQWLRGIFIRTLRSE